MRGVVRLLPVVLAAALGLAQPAAAADGMTIGAAEDAPKSIDPLVANAKMELAVLAGLDAIRIGTVWTRGKTEPTEVELLGLQNAADAASLHGIRVYFAIYHFSRNTPLTVQHRAEFAEFASAIATAVPTVTDFIVGNEPNLNLFWMPQFKGNGGSASPAAYLKLLAETYDALKAVSPEINVVGGALAPRGSDKPRLPRPTHSPTRFLEELARAYRKSGRRTPIMDALAIHPYMDNSRTPPTYRHRRSGIISLSDYDKLVVLLGRIFAGTPQRGAKLPIIYDEFGVQSQIPRWKRDVYKNFERFSALDAVSERIQGAYYRQALAIAHCQPTVETFLLFHVSDEEDLDRWQSGIYYADDTPKSSFPVVQAAIEDTRGAVIARCVQLKTIRFPPAKTYPVWNTDWAVRLGCRRPCRYIVRVETFRTRRTVLRSVGISRRTITVRFAPEALLPGRYRFTVRLLPFGGRGIPVDVERESAPFTVR